MQILETNLLRDMLPITVKPRFLAEDVNGIYVKRIVIFQDAEGQYLLGICYENGWGTENDEAAAGKMYSAAAKSGHDGALYNLAAFHEYGLGGEGTSYISLSIFIMVTCLLRVIYSLIIAQIK